MSVVQSLELCINCIASNSKFCTNLDDFSFKKYLKNFLHRGSEPRMGCATAMGAWSSGSKSELGQGVAATVSQ
jgi:hypothetical protein